MIYFLDGNQEVIKIVRSSAVISAIQTQELPENNSLMIDRLSVQLKNDERLFDAQYMAIKSYKGNRNSFDMYRIVTEVVPDATTEFEGVQVAPYELEGVVVEDLRPKNRTVEYVAEQILADSDWRLGYVDDNLPTVTTNFYYLSAKDSLKKLQELTGVEFTFKVEISGNEITDKWVEAYRELGNRTLKRFNYGTNALTVKRETNHSELYTALIGRGKGEETESGGHGRKITFKDVVWSKSSGNPVDKPAGQKYIELPEATSLYGTKQLDGTKKPRIGLVEFSKTEDPDVLIKETWEALQYCARPKVLFSATVANIGDTGIGDTVTIHRHDLNMHYKTRVRKVVRDRKNNDYTQVDIGDVVHTPSTKRQSTINSKLDNLESNLSDVQAEVSYVVKSADGKNDITYGNVEPERKRVGDSWVRDHPSLAGETQWLVWDGEAWELIMDTSETTKNADAIAGQQQDIAETQATADEAVEQIDTAVANAGFTSLNETISSVQAISNQAQTNASTAIDNALEAMQQANQAVDNTGSLNIRVDEVENTLSVKADKQTVDTLAGTVQSLGSEFDVVAGQVSSKVWNTDIETAIDGIEVGGRNLLSLYNLDMSRHTNVEIDYEDGIISGTGSYYMSFEHVKLIPDTDYTFRYQRKNTDRLNLYVRNPRTGVGNYVLIYPNENEPHTFKLPQSVIDEIGLYQVRPYFSDSTLWDFELEKLKLERGNTATDWTPAPEDTAKSISAVQSDVTQKHDSITSTVSSLDGRVVQQKQTLDSISSTVSGHGGRLTTVEQTASGLQSTVAGKANQSQVTQLSDLLSSTVEDVEGNTTQISQLADNINLRVEKNDVINQINISDENILIQSENILLDGDVTVRGTAWMDGAVIANASIDGAKIQDATIGSAKIVNLDVNKISGNTTEFVRSAWNSGLDNVTIDASGMYMTGSGYWRRTYISATGFDLYNGGGGSNKAGAIGYFKEHKDNTSSSENYFHASKGGKHFIGIGANLGRDVALGYAPYTTTPNGYYRALTVDGSDGRIRFYTPFHPGVSDYSVSLDAWDGTSGLYGAGFQSADAGIVFASSGTNIWDSAAGKWDSYNMHNRQRIGMWGNSGIQVNTGNNVMEMWSGGGLQFYTNFNTLRMSFSGNLDIYSNISMKGNSILNQSDIRLKENVKDSELNALREIKRLRFIEWDWKKNHFVTKGMPSGRQFGIEAQYSPLLQTTGVDDHYLNVDMTKQVNLNSKAVQELLIRLEALENE